MSTISRSFLRFATWPLHSFDTQMATWLLFAAIALFYLQSVNAIPNCPIYGPEFPPPQRLSQHPQWQQAMTNLSAAFDYMNANVTGTQLSYSVQIFSTNPGGGIIAQRHWTANNLPPNTEGVKKVNGDTCIALAASLRSLLSWRFWLRLGTGIGNTPITEFIPSWHSFRGRHRRNLWMILEGQIGMRSQLVLWHLRFLALEETVRAPLYNSSVILKADQCSDGVLGELTQTPNISITWESSFPALQRKSLQPCGAWPLCSRQGIHSIGLSSTVS